MFFETCPIEIGSMTRSFEMYYNLSFILQDDVAMESKLFDRLGSIKNNVVEFFKKLIKSIKNFFLKYLGKGKLLNIKAVKTIHTYNNKWIKKTSGPLEDLLRMEITGDMKKQKSVIEKAFNIFNEIENELFELGNQVETDVINSPKIHHYTYYKADAFKQIEKIPAVFEQSVTRLLAKASEYSMGSSENKKDVYSRLEALIITISKTAGFIAEGLLQSIVKASYISQKENSTIEFDDEEVEVEFVFD